MHDDNRRVANLLESRFIGRADRRAVLRGATGAALSLPFLELFSNGAHAQKAAPKRLIVCYAGGAMGGDGDRAPLPFVPVRTGKLADMPLPLSLHPLGGAATWPGTYLGSGGQVVKEPMHGAVAMTTPDVRKWVSVITGLRLPGSGAAAAQSMGHRGTVSPLLSGTTGSGSSARCNGETADVVADRAFGQGKRVIRALVQARNYGNGGGEDMYMSWRREATGMQPNAGQVSPSNLFDALLGGFDPAQAGQGSDAGERQRRRRLLSIDMVLPARGRLVAQLGSEDRKRVERHFDLLTQLHARVRDLDAGLTGCAAPRSPGADPPLGGIGSPRGGGGQNFGDGEGYSNELRRAEVFADLIAFAMSCDLSRVATIQYLYTQTFMNAMQLTGLRSDIHQVSHGGGTANGSGNDAVGLCHHYSVRSFAYLVNRIASIEDEGGKSAIENTALVLTYEAGHGPSSHSGNNMACLVAGTVGGLLAGEHVRLDNVHPAKVLVTALGCVGLPAKLGELTDSIPQMLVRT